MAIGKTETMTDVVVPGYKKRSAKGEVFFNEMSKQTVINTIDLGNRGYIERTQCTPPLTAYFDGTRSTGFFAYNTRLALGLDSDSFARDLVQGSQNIVSSSDYQDALKEVGTKVAAERGRGPINMYEDIAEYKQTLGTAGQILEQIRGIVSKIPLTQLKAASSAYLLYRYGIAPLVKDLLVAYEALEVIRQKTRQTTRASVELSGFSRDDSFLTLGHVAFDVKYDTGIQKTDVVNIRAMSYDEYTTSQSFESGLSLKNLILTPWDLIPLSFVADWFLNIGDLLASQVPAFGFKQLGAALTVTRTITTQYFPSRTYATGLYSVVSPVSGNLVVTNISKIRTPGLPSPGFVVNADFGFDKLLRQLDASALIAQRLRFR
jgi:hypothetical protein